MKIISLCSGIGGLDLAARMVDPEARTVAYCELEPFPIRVLEARMKAGDLDEAVILGDLTKVDWSEWRGKADTVVAGFPCQPHSLAGRRKGTADERWIWPSIAQAIKEVEASTVFLENVPGLISSGGLLAVLRSLASLGFNAEWGTLRASDVGATHRRDRVFILAQRAGASELADSSCARRARHERKSDGLTSCSTELADCNSPRCNRLNANRQSEDGSDIGDAGRGSRAEVADAEQRLRGRRCKRDPESGREDSKAVRGDFFSQPNLEGCPLPRSPGPADLTAPDNRRVNVADASCLDSPGRRVVGDVRGAPGEAQGEARQRERSRDTSDYRCLNVADSNSPERLPDGGDTDRQNDGRNNSGGSSGDNVVEAATKPSWPCSWPPGPSDHKAWAEILAKEPGLAPAIEPHFCGVADGLPEGLVKRALATATREAKRLRRDRLKALGIAVVPCQAAAAWVVLQSRFNEEVAS